MISIDRLNELFEYKDGFLYRKITTCSTAKAGDKIRSVEQRGYVVVQIDGKSYKVHRLIFLMHHGYLPEKIDHVDCNKQNNRIENLREATHTQNLMNRPKYRSNTSGYKGVSLHKKTQKWQASIRINGKQNYLGLFDSPLDAYHVYCEYGKKHHADFFNPF